jgi:hypothetical protein
MLLAAVLVLCVAALAGLTLAMLHGSLPDGRRVPWAAGIAHGAVGAAGLALLALGLWRSPVHGAQQGATTFGPLALALICGTLLLGAAPVLARLRKRRPPIMALGLHATLAVMGIVLLAAYLSMPV